MHEPKAKSYAIALAQIKNLVSTEPDTIANMANVAAVLKTCFDFHWVGFYLANDRELVLGPFQGPVACTRIAFNRGVCGHAANTQQTIMVPNVHEFKGHIACSSASNSEIVVPRVLNGKTQFVLDVDSIRLADFDEVDKTNLEMVVAMIPA